MSRRPAPSPGSLLPRIEALKVRAEEARRRLRASEEWLARNGAATYGPRTRGKSLSDRKTRPIREEYFTRIVRAGACLGCSGGTLEFKRRPSGGSYYACSSPNGHLCYYIGYNTDTGVGYEMIVAAWKAA